MVGVGGWVGGGVEGFKGNLGDGRLEDAYGRLIKRVEMRVEFSAEAAEANQNAMKWANDSASIAGRIFIGPRHVISRN